MQTHRFADITRRFAASERRFADLTHQFDARRQQLGAWGSAF